MNTSTIKSTVTITTGLLSSLLGILYIPVLLMVACNLIDYITGLAAAKYRREPIDSYRGFKGITKKVCMWLLVVIGAITDQLLKYAAETIGLQIPFTFMAACIVAIWIICNEMISILENMVDIGVPVPPFLKPIIKNLKSQVEKIPEDYTEAFPEEQIEGEEEHERE